MTINEFIQSFKGSTIQQVISNIIYNHTETQLIRSCREHYYLFPERLRRDIDTFTTPKYGKKILDRTIDNSNDVTEVFKLYIPDVNVFFSEINHDTTDKDIINIFSLLLHRLAHFAMESPSFKRNYGIPD